MMDGTLASNRANARLAAALFLFVCIPLSIWGDAYVGPRVYVPQDPGATARNLLSNEFIFRTAIVVHIVGFVFYVIMTSLFYGIFQPVDKHLARLMFIPIIAQCAIIFITGALDLSALSIVKNGPDQETAFLLMRIKRTIIGADKIIFGLSYIPFGMLVWRSGFVPRIFAILIFVSAAGYVIDTCSMLLLDRPVYLIIRPVRFLFVGYVVAMFWFLIKGVEEKKR